MEKGVRSTKKGFSWTGLLITIFIAVTMHSWYNNDPTGYSDAMRGFGLTYQREAAGK